MDHNLNAYHECGARMVRGRTCKHQVRAPKRFCGTHQNQYNIHTANGLHPELWEQHQAKIVRRAEQRVLQWVRHHPVLSQFPAIPIDDRMNRYVIHTNFLNEINVVLRETSGYFFPIETTDIVVLPGVPQPARGFLETIAQRVNEALRMIWVLNVDVHQEMDAIIHLILVTAPPRAQPRGELGQFANDNQNVHKTVTVNMVKDIVNRVLKIAVPSEYSCTNGNRTAGEILIDVPMSSTTAGWFMQKYVAHESIYEYGPGIYARVMDAVWQYIRTSPDKNDLCKILGIELLDSVNMCAQGNLTRICNVLAGYLEGVNTETQGEQLQRRMAKLMDLENAEDRIREGKKILEELAVPMGEQEAWIEALG